MFRLDVIDIDSAEYKYLTLLVKDIMPFNFLSTLNPLPLIDQSSHVFCLLYDHLPALPHILEIIPPGSYLVIADKSLLLINYLNCSDRISCPFSHISRSDIYLLS